ncbi:MAG: insulinase family protein, partial [Chitinophagaceae bacterium]
MLSMNVKFGLLAATLLFSAAANSQARLVEKVTRTGSELVIPYEKYVLPNGLTVVLHEDHSDPVVHVDVTYHVGSAREEIGKSGFAHFFEHMMFEGSEHAPKGLFDKLLPDNNGSTNTDRTNYYETIPPNKLEQALWLESDRMGFLLDAVTQKRFEVQRATVKNERGQRYDNAPYGLVREVISKNLYPYGHPYSWMTIGYLEDLDRSDVNDLKNFFLRWYGPNNATITIGGDVKPANVLRLVEKYFAAIPRGPEVKPVEVSGVVLKSDRYVTLLDNYARLPRFYVTMPTVPLFHRDMVALDCLAEILGQGKNSVLYQMMVKKQLALSATAYQTNAELAGALSFEVTPAAGKTLAEMETLLRAALDSFEARGIRDEDIAKFKGSQEAQLINGLQSVQGKVTQLAFYQTFTGDPNRIGSELEELRKLTKDDVLRVYNEYVKGQKAVLVSTVPRGQAAMVAHEPNHRIDSSVYDKPDYGYELLKYVKASDKLNRSLRPAAGTVPPVKAPAFWKKDWAGGLRSIGTFNNETPTVALSLYIPGGHLASANDLSKAGLASFFAAMMNEETRNHSAEDISQELARLGASLSISSGLNGITVTVQTLKKNMDPVLALMEERLFRPRFTEATFNRIKSQRLQSFKLAKSQPAAIADAVFARLNYGSDNILGLPQGGTEETVKNIELKDIKEYYANYLTSRDARLVVVGDVQQAEVEAKLAFLKNLPDKKIELPKVNAAPTVEKTKVYLVDVPKGAQTEFRAGYATGMKWDATGDYYRSVLTNFTLGGNFSSRLNQNLREDKGWTYGAGTAFRGNPYGGEFRFSSGIRADVTDSALLEFMKDVNEYVSNGPTDADVEFMRDALGQADAMRYETPGQKLEFISRILEYNLPADYTVQQNKILNTITRAQLKQAAQ